MWLAKGVVACALLLLATRLVEAQSCKNVWALNTTESHNQSQLSEAYPNLQVRVHKTGEVRMSVTNYGRLATSFIGAIDPEMGTPDVPSLEFPAYSVINYMYEGGIWIGAVVGNDTLVSTGLDGWLRVFEMYPDMGVKGDIVKLSNQEGDSVYHYKGVAHAEYVATCFDTLTDQAWTGSVHQPLGLEIRQHSYSWSGDNIDNFVILRYTLKNFGDDYLQDPVVGFYMDSDVGWPLTPGFWSDDITGSICHADRAHSSDSMTVAWVADNDGDPIAGAYTSTSATGVMGMAFIEGVTSERTSYNYWFSKADASQDWGPRQLADGYDFGTGGLGTPEGDSSKYHTMSYTERDYDQAYAAIDHTPEGWLPPHAFLSEDFADGYDTRFQLSAAIEDLAPGDSTKFAVVVAVAPDFHVDPMNFAENFSAGDPDPYYANLNFASLEETFTAALQHYRSVFEGIPGDLSGDAVVNIADVVYFINYVFLNGPAPLSLNSADANGDCRVNITDAVYLVNFLFSSGPAPLEGCVIN